MNAVNRDFASITRLLDRVRTAEGEFFTLHYGLRNPPSGHGLGLMGVESEELIEAYAEGLHRTYVRLRDLGWRTPQPHPDIGRVPVYVCDTSTFFHETRPFTYTHNGLSWLVLRSENGEPTREGMLRRARVDAVHEATHAFTHLHRPRRTRHIELPDPYAWLDEATATLLEGELYPDYPECLRHAYYWVACPDLSLERDVEGCPNGYAGGWPGGYFAAWFLRYLLQHLPDTGWDLLRETWEHAARAAEEERPVTVLARLLRARGHDLASADPAVPDLFTAYAVATYFLGHFAPLVRQRFGERSLAARIAVPRGREVGLSVVEALEHLSYRYYRFDHPAGASRLTATLTAEVPRRHCHLKAALVLAGDSRWPPRPVFLTAANGPEDLTCLRGELSLPPDTAAHAVLVVANVFVPPTRWPMHEHALQRYTFSAIAS
jgi:hypothetical protein